MTYVYFSSFQNTLYNHLYCTVVYTIKGKYYPVNSHIYVLPRLRLKSEKYFKEIKVKLFGMFVYPYRFILHRKHCQCQFNFFHEVPSSGNY